ncbi:phosphoribosylanthranilate isomerase [Sporomusa malonica]|uniref:N-(5'-phosphoribosyl)anthranilate isomerase n=1 Tax=Sporomusa malonica TaxID=112901 RepID=A0A1W2BR53_9FIRM|nr:phosphoribosylanthranilate isomerase [Sporomusa malonica]
MAAREFGADLIGLVFAESRRRVTVEEARKIACQTPGICKVGVFVNAPLTEVQSIARECQLDYVQLHGDESPEYCSLVGYPVIKAFSIRPGFSSEIFKGYQASWTLFDTFSAGQQGGTGKAFDWQEAQALVCQTPRPFMVAGGLTPDNVGEAIQILTPDGVDVSGGVETNKVKDLAKIERFIAAVRGGGRAEC